jgi:hypothetical protein
LDEFVESVSDGGISPIESIHFIGGNALVCGKWLQNAGSQGSVEFFVELEKNQAELIAVGEQTVAAGVGDLLN